MIKLSNVTKKFGNKTAISNISLTVRSGEILGLLGPNGAGKSTTMRIIAGYFSPTSGSVEVAGYDVVKQPVIAKKYIGYLPENPPLYKDMTVKDYIGYAAELKGLRGKDKAYQVKKVMEYVGITDVKQRLIGHISRGYRQRVGLAQALVGEPRVLILDEPTVGLDPQQIIEVRQLIKKFGGERTVILSSHILSEVSNMCHKVAIINKGKLIAENTPRDLSKSLMRRQKIVLQVKGSKINVCSVMKNIPQIKNFTVNKVIDKDLYEYTVESQTGDDIREKLFCSMAKNNFPILEMKSSYMSLENVFLELVTEEPHMSSLEGGKYK